MKFKNNKAISPAITTLLLVAVSLLVVGIIYAWLGEWTKDQTVDVDTVTKDQSTCTFSGVKLDDCRFLNSTDKIYLLVTNTGKNDLTLGFTVAASDGSATYEAKWDVDINKGSYKMFDSGATTVTAISGTVAGLSTVSKIRVTPIECSNQSSETKTCTIS